MNDGDNPTLEAAIAALRPPTHEHRYWRQQPFLIGMGGRLGSGKDAFADFLVGDHGFLKIGMSDPLNRALLAENPFIPVKHGWSTDEYFEWAESNEWPHSRDLVTYSALHEQVGFTEAKRVPEVRRLLQALGTGVGRNMLGEDTWTEVAARSITEQRVAGTPVVVTGIRYPNERSMIERLGGHLVWIERPVAAQQVISALDAAIEQPAAAQQVHQHSSETSLGAKDFECTVLNEGSLEDLRQLAADLVRSLGEEDS